MGWEGTERLYANACSVIILPAQSLLGNVIHHAWCSHRTDSRGGMEGHRSMAEGCSCIFVAYPRHGFNKRVNWIPGHLCTVSLDLQTDKCHVSQIYWETKMLIINIFVSSINSSSINS